MSFRRLAGPLCIAFALVAGEIVGSTRRADPQNLLLITLDTMRADRWPAYGFQGVHTPALDRIANEGLVFEEAFAAVPLTLPSHTSLLTGLNPPRVGVRDNASPPLAEEFTTLAERLRGQGLRTAAFVASAVLASGRGLSQGFEHYSEGAPGNCPGAPARRRAEEVTNDALAWLTANDAAPFFAWMHLFDTHRPYDLPDDYRDRHLDPYLDAIAYEDAQIARVIAHLDARGLTRNTVIVIVGDHGESMGSHGEESHGLFVYQEALRVPLMVRGPGVSPGRVTSVARLVDVTPTVLDLFGVTATGLDGVSLARAGLGRGGDPPFEVYAESMYPQRFGWSGLRSLRADRYKLIDAPRLELYDLDRDPAEARNVATEHPAVVDAMRRRLRSFDPERTAPQSVRPAEKSVVERIASLGYVGDMSAEPANSERQSPDPKDRVDQFNRMTELQWSKATRRRAACR